MEPAGDYASLFVFKYHAPFTWQIFLFNLEDNYSELEFLPLVNDHFNIGVDVYFASKNQEFYYLKCKKMPIDYY